MTNSIEGSKPTQAIILAGGLGTRLHPITEKIPKPMVDCNGRPFLAHLIDMLKSQGIRKIVLLLGYKAEIIQNYFKDGSDFGVEITYSVTSVENDTGRRLYLARHLAEKHFLLLYCDNYWPLDLKKMWSFYLEMNLQMSVTVYANNDEYSRDNLSLRNGVIEIYDKTRTQNNLSGVDIGFMIVSKAILELLPNENISFESYIYPKLVEQKQLAGYLTNHRYYSIGDINRLERMREFLNSKPFIFLDRDGVLNKKMPRGEYVCTLDEWQWIEGALEGLVLLYQHGYNLILVTNQAGIAREKLTIETLENIHGKMTDDICAAGGILKAIYYCPHGWDDKCDCRKPNPGMLFDAQHDFNIDLSRAIFIGDDERDMQAAKAAGCNFIFASEKNTLNKIARKITGKEHG